MTPDTELLGDGEKLDDISKLSRLGNIGGCDPLDALVVDVIEPNPGAEREARQDRGLGSRVGSGYIGRRIRLGISELLGLGQCGLAVLGARVRHTREDVVRCSVDDA